MASLTQWTWVWVNSRSWWLTGRPGVLRFMESLRVGHDWATELNWTDVISNFLASGYGSCICFQFLKIHQVYTYTHLAYFYFTVAFQGLFTCCGSLLFVNGDNYLKLKPFTVFIPFPWMCTTRTHWLYKKVVSLFLNWYTFWLCIMGNVLWLGIVTFIQIKNKFSWPWLCNIYSLI